jgi:hypothetical protein
MSNSVCIVNASPYLEFGENSDNAVTHVLVGESTLQQVATRLQLDPASLADANPQIKDPYHLNVLQEIHVPSTECKASGDAQTTTLKHDSSGESSTSDTLTRSAIKARLSRQVQLREYLQGVGHPGDFVDLTMIIPGALNKLDTKVETRDNSVGDVYSVQKTIFSLQHLNTSGLENYLSELNNGGQLTDFERSLVGSWSKQDTDTIITPIVQIGSEGVKGYKIQTGGSGLRTTAYYDRDGVKLLSKQDEAGVQSEGLGPIDYVFAGAAAKSAVGWIVGKVFGGAAKLAGKAFARSAAEEIEEAPATANPPKVDTTKLPDEPSILKNPTAQDEPSIENQGPYRSPGKVSSPQTPTGPQKSSTPQPAQKDPWSRFDPTLDKPRRIPKKPGEQ